MRAAGWTTEGQWYNARTQPNLRLWSLTQMADCLKVPRGEFFEAVMKEMERQFGKVKAGQPAPVRRRGESRAA